MSTKFTINRCLRVKRVIEFQFEYLKKKNKKKGKFASLSSSIWISFLFFISLIPFSPILISLSSVSRLWFSASRHKAHFLYHNNWSFESGSFISCQYFAWFLMWFHALLLFFWHNLRQAVCLKLFEVNFVWVKEVLKCYIMVNNAPSHYYLVLLLQNLILLTLLLDLTAVSSNRQKMKEHVKGNHICNEGTPKCTYTREIGEMARKVTLESFS